MPIDATVATFSSVMAADEGGEELGMASGRAAELVSTSRSARLSD